jgi:hypothetical protein
MRPPLAGARRDPVIDQSGDRGVEGAKGCAVRQDLSSFDALNLALAYARHVREASERDVQ